MKGWTTFSAVLLAALLAIPAHADDELVPDIQATLQAHPQLSRYYIKVDTFGGLAVLHGWVRNNRLRAMAEAEVRQVRGVDRIFNYIRTDSNSESIARAINRSERIQGAQANMNDQIRGIGTLVNVHPELYHGARTHEMDTVEMPLATLPPNLAASVREQLELDPVLALYDINVDNYERVVLLHGDVPDVRTARDAERVAARTPGVRKVVSYLNVAETAAVQVPEWPYVVELHHSGMEPARMPSRPEYVRYERYDWQCER
ncbi:MAG TPA: BON domain-containing protein [Planctomycetota bacterium]|nr:BON domain-containing protein [Planctomycetota bacterium]